LRLAVRDDYDRPDDEVVDCGAVVGVAAVAAVASYEHAYALVRANGETGWIGRLVPLTVDGLIYASSIVMLDPARREVPVPGRSRSRARRRPGGRARPPERVARWSQANFSHARWLLLPPVPRSVHCAG
jgi:hypothetical protein